MKETRGERKVRLESSRNMTNRVKESGKMYKREKVDLDGIDRSSPEMMRAVEELKKQITDYQNEDKKEYFLNLIKKSIEDNIEVTITYPDGDDADETVVWNTDGFMKVITDALENYKIVPKRLEEIEPYKTILKDVKS